MHAMIVLIGLIVVLSGSMSAAHEPGSLSGPPGERLGKVTFPLSCQTAAEQLVRLREVLLQAKNGPAPWRPAWCHDTRTRQPR
jgi:hypothetical protein